MCICMTWGYVCSPSVCRTHREQKRASDTPGIEVSRWLCAAIQVLETEAESFAGASRALNC